MRLDDLAPELLAAVAAHLPWHDVVRTMGCINGTIRRALLANAPMFNRDWPLLRLVGDGVPAWPLRRLVVCNDVDAAWEPYVAAVEELDVHVILNVPWPLTRLPNLRKLTLTATIPTVFDGQTWPTPCPSVTTVTVSGANPWWPWLAAAFPSLTELTVAHVILPDVAAVARFEHLTRLVFDDCAVDAPLWTRFQLPSLASLRCPVTTLIAQDCVLGLAFPTVRRLELDAAFWTCNAWLREEGIRSTVAKTLVRYPCLETVRLNGPGAYTYFEAVAGFLAGRAMRRLEIVFDADLGRRHHFATRLRSASEPFAATFDVAVTDTAATFRRVDDQRIV
jgi:hypothetical protein